MQSKNYNYEVYVNENNRHEVPKRTVIEKVNAKVKNQKFENGIVKITNHTEDKVTKLYYNYKKLHKTGFDTKEFVDKPNAELTEGDDGEIEGITPLEDDEVLQFLYDSGKRKDEDKDYFACFDQKVVNDFHEKYLKTFQKKK